MSRSLEEARRLLKEGKSVDCGEGKWEQILKVEKFETGKSPTGDSEFDHKGYKIIRNICDPNLLIMPVPELRGLLNYDSTSMDESRFTYTKIEEQVVGSVARYVHPFHRKAYTIVKRNLEKSINQSLYKTYYYDRFYFPGQDLKCHLDRDSCEISVTIHCGSNLKDRWPICIKAVDGSVTEADLNPGDALIYKGCERPHWRLPMPGVKRNMIRKFLGMDELYYHQIFFHFVLAYGSRSFYAGDSHRHKWL